MPLFTPPAPPVLLGETEMAASGPASAVVGPFGNYKWLLIEACVTSYSSGGGIFALRFGISGGAIDTGTRYRHRNLVPPATTGTAWQVGVASSTTTAATMMLLANANISGGRYVSVSGMNRSSTNHTFRWHTVNEATSAIAHPVECIGDGSYVSAAAGYITSVQMVVSGGDLGAGSGFAVSGVGALR